MNRRVAGGLRDFRRATEAAPAALGADSGASGVGLRAGIAGLRCASSGPWSGVAQPCELAAVHNGRAGSNQDPDGRRNRGAIVRPRPGERRRKA
jgi:uncharacterized protein with NRDE domain